MDSLREIIRNKIIRVLWPDPPPRDDFEEVIDSEIDDMLSRITIGAGLDNTIRAREHLTYETVQRRRYEEIQQRGIIITDSGASGPDDVNLDVPNMSKLSVFQLQLGYSGTSGDPPPKRLTFIDDNFKLSKMTRPFDCPKCGKHTNCYLIVYNNEFTHIICKRCLLMETLGDDVVIENETWETETC